MFVQIKEVSQPTIHVTRDDKYYHPIDISFRDEKNEKRITVCLQVHEAKALAEQLLSACDAEPITPIGDFQDSTPNDK